MLVAGGNHFNILSVAASYCGASQCASAKPGGTELVAMPTTNMYCARPIVTYSFDFVRVVEQYESVVVSLKICNKMLARLGVLIN